MSLDLESARRVATSPQSHTLRTVLLHWICTDVLIPCTYTARPVPVSAVHQTGLSQGGAAEVPVRTASCCADNMLAVFIFEVGDFAGRTLSDGIGRAHGLLQLSDLLLFESTSVDGWDPTEPDTMHRTESRTFGTRQALVVATLLHPQSARYCNWGSRPFCSEP